MIARGHHCLDALGLRGIDVEDFEYVCQACSLVRQALGGRSILPNQCGVLLSHLVMLSRSHVHLSKRTRAIEQLAMKAAGFRGDASG